MFTPVHTGLNMFRKPGFFMPLNLHWAQPNPALGPTYGLEFYAGIIVHYGMLLAAIGIVGGFVYMYMIHDPQSKQKGIKIVLGSAMALVLLALLPSIIDKFLVPSGASFGITQPSGGQYVFPSPATTSSSGGNWLGQLLAGAFGWLVGGVVSSLLAMVTGFLNITLFHTYSLVDGGGFAQSVWNLYRVTAPIATGILAIILAYSFSKQAVGGSLLETGNTFDRTNSDPRILIPKAIAATFMAWSGFYVVGFVLSISNYMTNYFLHQTYSTIMTNFWGKLGLDITAFTSGALLIWAAPLITPFLTLIVVGLIAWIVITYFIRMFEIAFLTALLPIASAFWTMNETSNIWSSYIAEIFGAIFIQPLQVFLWWVIVNLITGAGTSLGTANASANTFFEGIVGLFFIASAPTLLRRFIGHSVAGGSLVGQVLEAMGVRSVVKKAWEASPASNVINKVQDSVRSGNEQRLRRWGESGASGSPLGKAGSKVGGGIGKVAGSVVGATVGVGLGTVGGIAGATNVFAAGGPLGSRFTEASHAIVAGLRTGVTGGVDKFGNAGAKLGTQMGAEVDKINMPGRAMDRVARGGANVAGRAFQFAEMKGDLSKSRNAMAHERTMQGNQEIARNNLETNVTRDERRSNARITNPELTRREQFAHKQNDIATGSAWNDAVASKPLYRLSMENENIKKQIGQKYGSFKGETVKNGTIPNIGEASMNARTQLNNADISRIIKQNNAVFNYVVRGRS